jgi:hypothetical protein
LPVEIIEDVVAGARYEISPSTANLTRVFSVNGVVPTMDALAQVFSNGGANGINLPAMGETHPTAAGLIATGFSCAPGTEHSRTSARLHVVYAPQWTVEVSGDNCFEEAMTWPPGHPLANLPILIPYCSAPGSSFTLPIDPRGVNFDPATNNGTGPGSVGIRYSIGRIRRLSNKINLRFTTIAGRSPVTVSQTFRGKINSTVWQGGDPGTWICRAIDGTSVPQPWGFTMWRTIYEFSYDPATWSTAVCYTFDGEPPPDVHFDPSNSLTGNGMYRIPDSTTIDFNTMGMPNAL